MAFQPSFRITPRMLRQLKAIEQTNGLLRPLRLEPDWIGEVRHRTHVREPLASHQIEGESLTLEEAFALGQVWAQTLRSADRAGDYTDWLAYFLGRFSYQIVKIQELARGEEV